MVGDIWGLMMIDDKQCWILGLERARIRQLSLVKEGDERK